MSRIDDISNNADYSEKSIERYLVKRVADIGGKALKYSNPYETGYPDRLILVDGRCYWCELKTKGKKPRRIQSIRHEELRNLGFKVWVADSRELIDEIIHEIEN